MRASWPTLNRPGTRVLALTAWLSLVPAVHAAPRATQQGTTHPTARAANQPATPPRARAAKRPEVARNPARPDRHVDRLAVRKAPRGLGESIDRLQTRTFDFRDRLEDGAKAQAAIAAQDVPLDQRPAARPQLRYGEHAARRLSSPQRRRVRTIYQAVADALRQHAPETALGGVVLYASAQRDGASARDGTVFFSEDLVLEIESFADKRFGAGTPRARRARDAMIAAVIGHELSHVVRADVLRQPAMPTAARGAELARFASVSDARWRGYERAADIVGQRLAEAAGFAPEGMALLMELVARDAAARGLLSKQADHPQALQRAKDARRQLLGRPGGEAAMAALTPMPTLERQLRRADRAVRWMGALRRLFTPF